MASTPSTVTPLEISLARMQQKCLPLVSSPEAASIAFFKFARKTGARLAVALLIKPMPPPPPHSASSSSSSSSSSYSDHEMLGACLTVFFFAGEVCFGNLGVLLFVCASWLVGTVLVFLLYRLMGSKKGITDVFVSLGYSTAPLALLEPFISATQDPLPRMCLMLKFVGVIWAARSAGIQLREPEHDKKAFLFAYPVVLFCVFMYIYV